jgi:hypothetical protein
VIAEVFGSSENSNRAFFPEKDWLLVKITHNHSQQREREANSQWGRRGIAEWWRFTKLNRTQEMKAFYT